MTASLLETASRVLLERAAVETAALAGRFPELGQALSKWNGALPPFVLDATSGEPIDLVVDNGRYYGRDGRVIASEQVQLALSQNANFTGRASLPAVGHGLLHEISRNILSDAGMPVEQQERPASWSTGWSRVLIFCGTGLGLHILPIVERLDPRYVVIYEPHLELLYSAGFSVPWRRIIDRLSGPGRGFLVVSGSSPEKACVDIHAWLQKIPTVNFDGTRWIQHYDNPAFQTLKNVFTEHVTLLNRGIGFFFDERRQFINTLANLSQTQGLLTQNRPGSLSGDLIVVGSGPSLDRALPLIRRAQERAVVFSCGTGLTPLVRSGVRPDFHIELETSTQRYALARQVEDEEIFEKTTLIASNGYYPPSLALFRNRLTFFRPMNFGAMALRQLGPILTFGWPTVTNAAIALGHWLGFRRIFAFGLDLGYHDTSLQHSKRSLYFDEKAGKFHPDFTHLYGATALRSFYVDSRIEIEDNQGGRMFTNDIFYSSLLGFDHFLRETSATLIQCGLGARIRRAQTRRIEDMSETDFSDDKEATIAAIRERFRPIQVSREALQAVVGAENAKLQRILDDVEVIRAKPVLSQADFLDRVSQITLRIRDVPEAEESIRSLIYGDIEKLGIFSADLVATAGTEALKQRIWTAWQGGLGKLLRHMRDQMASIVAGEGVDPLPGASEPR